jgi:hypothetical protein
MRYLIIDVALAATMTSLFIVALAAVALDFDAKERATARQFNYSQLGGNGGASLLTRTMPLGPVLLCAPRAAGTLQRTRPVMSHARTISL